MNITLKSKCLSLVMILLLAAVTLQAQPIQFSYSDNGNGTVTVTGASYATYVSHPFPAFTIPSSHNGKPVTCIGDDFSGAWSLYFTSITIPESITNIGEYAFEDDSYLRSIYFEGNEPAYGPFSFETHSGGKTTAYYLAAAAGWTNDDFFPIPIELWTPETGSLEVTLEPAGAVADGVQWQVDGTNYDSGASIPGLIAGSHVVSFASAPGWTAPASKTVTIKKNSVNKVKATFTPWPKGTAPLTVQIIGGGAVSPNDNGKLLKLGKVYTLKAESNREWFFAGWTGAAGSESFASNNLVLHFTMQSNLVLQANFIANPFIDVAGQYIGLFQSDETNTLENSGYMTVTVSLEGAFSGYWETGNARHPLSGLLDSDFAFATNYAVKGEDPVTIEFAALGNNTIEGAISNSQWSSAIEMVQTDHTVATYSGHGTYHIGFTNAAGEEVGKATGVFANRGSASLSGKLPNNTSFSAGSFFSPTAAWPFYTSLYNGKGYLLGWMEVAPGDGGTDYSKFTAEGSFVWLQKNGTAQHLNAGSQ